MENMLAVESLYKICLLRNLLGNQQQVLLQSVIRIQKVPPAAENNRRLITEEAWMASPFLFDMLYTMKVSLLVIACLICLSFCSTSPATIPIWKSRLFGKIGWYHVPLSHNQSPLYNRESHPAPPSDHVRGHTEKQVTVWFLNRSEMERMQTVTVRVKFPEVPIVKPNVTFLYGDLGSFFFSFLPYFFLLLLITLCILFLHFLISARVYEDQLNF